jgi:hypothetical protein
MNLHINGHEMRMVELITEHVAKRGKVKAHFRAMIKGDRTALNRAFKVKPAIIVLERGPSDALLGLAFQPNEVVRIRGHKYRVSRRDFIRNKVWLHEVVE